MPRTKKPAGTAVDKRNGRRAELAPTPDVLAQPDRPEHLCPEAVAQWDAYWDSAAAGVQVPSDRGVVLRWVDAVDRYLRLLGEADLAPLMAGSTGQMVANPLYGIADKALATVERCEKQLGIGALNRSSLGIAVITEARSLKDMNARYGDDGSSADTDEEADDPRLSVVPGEVV